MTELHDDDRDHDSTRLGRLDEDDAIESRDTGVGMRNSNRLPLRYCSRTKCDDRL